MTTTQVLEAPSSSKVDDNTAPVAAASSDISVVPDSLIDKPKPSMTMAFVIVTVATLAMFLGTAVLIWFSSDGDLAGAIGVGLFAASWGGIGFGAMIAAVKYTDS